MVASNIVTGGNARSSVTTSMTVVASGGERRPPPLERRQEGLGCLDAHAGDAAGAGDRGMSTGSKSTTSV